MRTLPSFVTRTSLGGFTLALALAATACASRLPPIQLEGAPADVAQLVGNWAGEYISDTAFEPSGSILFSLQAGEKHAYGDVLMTRRGADRAYERYDPEHPTGRSVGLAQRLPILIVRTKDGYVTGELDPYWDFDRECEAHTAFRGRIRGNVIKGTYETRFEGPFLRRTGQWQVAKSTPPVVR